VTVRGSQVRTAAALLALVLTPALAIAVLAVVAVRSWHSGADPVAGVPVVGPVVGGVLGTYFAVFGVLLGAGALALIAVLVMVAAAAVPRRGTGRQPLELQGADLFDLFGEQAEPPGPDG